MAEEPGGLWEGVSRASGQVKVGRQEGSARGAVGGGRRGRKVWDGVDMSPLQPEEG